MKTLRIRILLASVITILAYTAMLQTACNKDETTTPYVDSACVDVNCNHGECSQGYCGCEPGWEGIYCDIRSIDKILGKWNALETITYSNVPANVNDTQSYDFYINNNGSSNTTFKLSGLSGKPNDTIICTLGDPVSHTFGTPGFYFSQTVSATVQDMFYTRGAGLYSSSGGYMDSLGYGRWYGQTGNPNFVVKDTVRIDAQKAP